MINNSYDNSGCNHDGSNLNPSIVSQQPIISQFLTISSHNVRDLSTTIKQQQLLVFLDIHNIDILGLSETKLNDKKAKYIFKSSPRCDYKTWWSSGDSEQGTGVGIILHNNLASHVVSCHDFKGRIIYVDLFFKGKVKLHIIQFYNHANPKDKQETLEDIKNFFLLLERLNVYNTLLF